MYQDPKTEIIKLQEAISELSSLNDIASAIGASMTVEEITEIIIDKSILTGVLHFRTKIGDAHSQRQPVKIGAKQNTQIEGNR